MTAIIENDEVEDGTVSNSVVPTPVAEVGGRAEPLVTVPPNRGRPQRVRRLPLSLVGFVIELPGQPTSTLKKEGNHSASCTRGYQNLLQVFI